MVVNITRIFCKMKNKSLEKNSGKKYYKMRKNTL